MQCAQKDEQEDGRVEVDPRRRPTTHHKPDVRIYPNRLPEGV
jgi:hypothetical protein